MIYCTADIHNDYDSFKELLKITEFNPENDKLYILGDIVDRGTSPDPYGLISHIRRFERQGSIEMIMGNHDKWLAEYIRNHLSGLVNRDYCYNSFDILNMVYSKDELAELADWIMSFPLQKQLFINGKKYLLAHAATSPVSMDENYYLLGTDDFLYCNDLNTSYISIVGHTPTPRIYWDLGIPDKGAVIYYNKVGNIIDIDTGCQSCSNGRLGCICLNTMEEFYV